MLEGEKRIFSMADGSQIQLSGLYPTGGGDGEPTTSHSAKPSGACFAFIQRENSESCTPLTVTKCFSGGPGESTPFYLACFVDTFHCRLLADYVNNELLDIIHLKIKEGKKVSTTGKLYDEALAHGFREMRRKLLKLIRQESLPSSSLHKVHCTAVILAGKTVHLGRIGGEATELFVISDELKATSLTATRKKYPNKPGHLLMLSKSVKIKDNDKYLVFSTAALGDQIESLFKLEQTHPNAQPGNLAAKILRGAAASPEGSDKNMALLIINLEEESNSEWYTKCCLQEMKTTSNERLYYSQVHDHERVVKSENYLGSWNLAFESKDEYISLCLHSKVGIHGGCPFKVSDYPENHSAEQQNSDSDSAPDSNDCNSDSDYDTQSEGGNKRKAVPSPTEENPCKKITSAIRASFEVTPGTYQGDHHTSEYYSVTGDGKSVVFEGSRIIEGSNANGIPAIAYGEDSLHNLNIVTGNGSMHIEINHEDGNGSNPTTEDALRIDDGCERNGTKYESHSHAERQPYHCASNQSLQVLQETDVDLGATEAPNQTMDDFMLPIVDQGCVMVGQSEGEEGPTYAPPTSPISNDGSLVQSGLENDNRDREEGEILPVQDAIGVKHVANDSSRINEELNSSSEVPSNPGTENGTQVCLPCRSGSALNDYDAILRDRTISNDELAELDRLPPLSPTDDDLLDDASICNTPLASWHIEDINEPSSDRSPPLSPTDDGLLDDASTCNTPLASWYIEDINEPTSPNPDDMPTIENGSVDLGATMHPSDNDGENITFSSDGFLENPETCDLSDKAFFNAAFAACDSQSILANDNTPGQKYVIVNVKSTLMCITEDGEIFPIGKNPQPTVSVVRDEQPSGSEEPIPIEARNEAFPALQTPGTLEVSDYAPGATSSNEIASYSINSLLPPEENDSTNTALQTMRLVYPCEQWLNGQFQDNKKISEEILQSHTNNDVSADSLDLSDSETDTASSITLDDRALLRASLNISTPKNVEQSENVPPTLEAPEYHDCNLVEIISSIPTAPLPQLDGDIFQPESVNILTQANTTIPENQTGKLTGKDNAATTDILQDPERATDKRSASDIVGLAILAAGIKFITPQFSPTNVHFQTNTDNQNPNKNVNSGEDTDTEAAVDVLMDNTESSILLKENQHIHKDPTEERNKETASTYIPATSTSTPEIRTRIGESSVETPKPVLKRRGRIPNHIKKLNEQNKGLLLKVQPDTGRLLPPPKPLQRKNLYSHLDFSFITKDFVEDAITTFKTKEGKSSGCSTSASASGLEPGVEDNHHINTSTIPIPAQPIDFQSIFGTSIAYPSMPSLDNTPPDNERSSPGDSLIRELDSVDWEDFPSSNPPTITHQEEALPQNSIQTETRIPLTATVRTVSKNRNVKNNGNPAPAASRFIMPYEQLFKLHSTLSSVTKGRAEDKPK